MPIRQGEVKNYSRPIQKIVNHLDLRTLLDRQAERARAKAGRCQGLTTTERRISRCRDLIGSYVDNEDGVDALEALSTRWLSDFESWLTAGPPGLSKTTAREHRDRVASCLRDAIKRGLLPNISLEDCVDAPELLGITPADLRSDVEALMAVYQAEIDCLDQTAGAPVTKSAALVSIGYAVLSIVLAGAGLEGLQALKASDLQGNRLQLRHIDASVELPDELVGIIARLRGVDCGDCLFGDMQGDAMAPMRRRIAMALRKIPGVDAEALFEPLSAWLQIAQKAPRHGLTSAEVRAVIDARYGRGESAAHTVEKAFASVVGSIKSLGREWYCLRCVGQAEVAAGATRGEAMLEHLRDARLLSADAQSYAPSDVKIRERNGRKEAVADRFLGSLLFVRSSWRCIEAINRYLMSVRGGFIYADRREGRLHYCAIPDCEIELLRAVFASRARRRVGHEEDHQNELTGLTAHITAGIYDGYEGRICRVVYDAERRVRKVIVSLQGACLRAQYAADPDYIELEI